MSPPDLQSRHTPTRFPRVSGDEPPVGADGMITKSFSPRERG